MNLDHVVKYRPPPTGARFMRSDAKVRMMMGPVGSGFQSTPVIADGRIRQRDRGGPPGARFNPRPSLLTGES